MPARPGAILTDIEGTTTPIAFVHDVLFPYARARLPAFLDQHAGDPALVAILAQIDAVSGGKPPLDSLLAWMDSDAKIAPLKTLQGMIWDLGYRQGELKGRLFPDVPAALRAWHASGIRLYVYSSGSEAAQRLLFGHSDAGDLTPLFSGFFDTSIGPKRERASYAGIAGAIGLAPAEILFLSDVEAELDAASSAGMMVCQLVRPEDGTVASARHSHASNFETIRNLYWGVEGAFFSEEKNQKTFAGCRGFGRMWAFHRILWVEPSSPQVFVSSRLVLRKIASGLPHHLVVVPVGRRKMEWNDEAILKLRVLWAEGHSTAEIGRRMGVSKNAVVGKAHRLTLEARPSPIRRDTDKTPRRRQLRRAQGPTLPELAAASPPMPELPTPVPLRAHIPAVERTQPPQLRVERPSPGLRAVPASRPGARVTPCCWPIGEPGTRAFRFCDEDLVGGKPYCEQHSALAYVKVRDRREDAA